MKISLRLLLAFLLVGFVGTDAFADIPKILPLKDLKPGTLAISFSVFKGVEPLPFDVVLGEPVDKMGSSFILARISGGPMDTPLEKIGAISGMSSGSPVFINCVDLDDCIKNGILVGALSYRIGIFIEGGMNCLLTPAEYMLGSRFGGYSAAIQFSNRIANKINIEDKEFVNLMAMPKIESLSSQAMLGQRCDESVKGELKPGSMVTVFLTMGAISFGGSGTVVWRDGDTVFIFGHPFLGTGMINYPFAHVAVADTVQTPSGAYKLPGCSLDTKGAMLVDGAFEVAGVIGRTAPTIPFKIEIHLNENGAVLEGEIVPSPMMGDIIRQIPTLWAGQLLGDLNYLSIAYQARLVIKNNPEIFLKNITPAQLEENPFARLFGKIDATLQKLETFGVSKYEIENIYAHVDFINDPVVWVKKTAFLSQKEATPGEVVYANVVLENTFSGDIQQMSFPIKVPLNFNDRLGVGASSVDILIQSGSKFTDKRSVVGRSSLKNFVSQLNQAMNYSPDVLYIQQIMPRLKSDDEVDSTNAKTSVKPSWKWTELQEGDLRLFPSNDKKEIVLTLSPELNGFIDFDATLSLEVKDKEEVVILEKKETKKRKWFNFFKK